MQLTRKCIWRAIVMAGTATLTGCVYREPPPPPPEPVPVGYVYYSDPYYYDGWYDGPYWYWRDRDRER